MSVSLEPKSTNLQWSTHPQETTAQIDSKKNTPATSPYYQDSIQSLAPTSNPTTSSASTDNQERPKQKSYIETFAGWMTSLLNRFQSFFSSETTSTAIEVSDKQTSKIKTTGIDPSARDFADQLLKFGDEQNASANSLTAVDEELAKNSSGSNSKRINLTGLERRNFQNLLNMNLKQRRLLDEHALELHGRLQQLFVEKKELNHSFLQFNMDAAKAAANQSFLSKVSTITGIGMLILAGLALRYHGRPPAEALPFFEAAQSWLGSILMATKTGSDTALSYVKYRNEDNIQKSIGVESDMEDNNKFTLDHIGTLTRENERLMELYEKLNEVIKSQRAAVKTIQQN